MITDSAFPGTGEGRTGRPTVDGVLLPGNGSSGTASLPCKALNVPPRPAEGAAIQAESHKCVCGNWPWCDRSPGVGSGDTQTAGVVGMRGGGFLKRDCRGNGSFYGGRQPSRQKRLLLPRALIRTR